MNLKKDKGSVTVIVLVTILFFVIVLSAAFSINASLRKSQLKSQLSLKGTYESNLNNADDFLDISTKPKYKFSNIYTSKQEYTDSNGDIAYIPEGYAVCISDGGNTISGGLVVTDAIDENNYSIGNEWVWVPDVGIDNGMLYGYATSDNAPANSGSNETFSDSTYNSEFQGMINSVKQYGGYYIGRYELTGTLDAPTEKSGIPIKNTTGAYSVSWKQMYKACKKLNLDDNGNEINSKIVVGMVYGCQWDNTLNWLILSGNKTYDEIAKDSTGWGNYIPSQFTYYDNGKLVTKFAYNGDEIIQTGCTEYTNANNIYDLAGNIAEWTMESNNTIRGKDCISFSASYRYQSSNVYSDIYYGSRATFYIKS